MKLKEIYKCDDLPEPFVTTADLEGTLTNDDRELTYDDMMTMFKAMENFGIGTRFTQVDGENDSECYYVKGYQLVNRTGVGAFVFILNKKRLKSCLKRRK